MNTKTQTNHEPLVVTTVKIPLSQYTRLTALKSIWGIPRSRIIRRGMELAMKEVSPALFQETDLGKHAGM